MKQIAYYLLGLAALLGPTCAPAAEPVSVMGLLHQSRTAVGNTNLISALDLAARAIRIDPAYAECWKQQGRVLMLLQRPAESLKSFATAQVLIPQDRDIARWSLYALVDLGRYREVVDTIEGLPLDQLGELGENLMVRVLSDLFDAGEGEQAGRVAQRWGQVSPHANSRAATASLMALGRHNLADAELALHSASREQPESSLLVALAYNQLGIALLKDRQTERAIEAFNHALTVRPDGLASLRELGWAYRANGDPEQAVEVWQRGIDQNPQAINWLGWVADAQLDMGQVSEAEHAADRLLEAQPQNEKARVLKLATLLILQQPGAEAFERATAAGPQGSRVVILGHAVAERYTKDFAQAASRLETYRQGAPADDEAKRMLLDTYGHWAASVSRREAVRPLTRILEIQPGHPGALRDLGWVYWARGERAKGLEYLEQAISGGVANRNQVIRQAYAGLCDLGEADQALDFVARWAPGAPLLPLGRSFFEEGRMAAAEPALQKAWGLGESPSETGFLLAHTRALNGRCGDLAVYLEPLLQPSNQVEMTTVMLDALYETLAICGDGPSTAALLKRVEQQLGARPEATPEVTDRLERSADQRRIMRDFSHALRLYQRVLERDTERLSYLRAADSAEALGRRQGAIDLLSGLSSGSDSEAVQQGARGKLAEYRGELDAAVLAYELSLEQEPEQPEVRKALFLILARQGKLADAREQVMWFVQKYEAGDLSVRTEIAEMWTVLGAPEDALRFWSKLSETYPDSAYFSIEHARALFQLGRPVEAEKILTQLNQQTEDVRSYELLATLQDALGHPDQVLAATEQGLQIEVTRDLLRMRAEAAEQMLMHTTALACAESVLLEDPGHTGMARLAGRALLALGSHEVARDYFVHLAQRNPANLNALSALRDLATQQRDFADAARVAQTITAQRPWDAEARCLYSAAQAGQGRFKAALETLRGHPTSENAPAVAAVLYHDITRGPYPGRNTPEQFGRHVARLKKEGYSFFTPDQLNLASLPGGKAIVLIVSDTDRHSLDQLDKILASEGARATYAGFTTAEKVEWPGRPTQADVKAMQDSGRWFIASSGPMQLRRIAVKDDGTLGNPLTQRQVDSPTTGQESDQALRQRLDLMLADLAAPLAAPRVLLYPRGDYGHIALDTDAQALAQLRAAVADKFNLAFAADDGGYLTALSDPLRLPIKLIPTGSTEDELMRHLAAHHPHHNLQLQYASVLSANGQHEEANTWFRHAQRSGASPGAISYYWGANLLQQGSLPAAKRLLTEALTADPSNPRIQAALQETKEAMDPQLHLLAARAKDDERNIHEQAGGWLRGHVTDTLRPEVLADHNRWRQKGQGSEEGRRAGVGARWYPWSEYWLDGRIWWMDYAGRALEDITGGFVRMRLPTARFGGDLNLEASRDAIDTVQAIRSSTEQWQYAMRSFSRLGNNIELYLNGIYTDRDDANETRSVDGRLLWRARGQPDVGVGLYGRIADSDVNPAAYYAPMELHQYQAYGQLKGRFNRLSYTASIQAGYGREQYDEWRFIWGTQIQLEYALWRRLYLFCDYAYDQSPTYDQLKLTGGLGTRF